MKSHAFEGLDTLELLKKERCKFERYLSLKVTGYATKTRLESFNHDQI